jgi:hypothetical protein
MPTNRKSIPAKDADFDVWLKNLSQYVTEHTSGSSPVWKHIPEADVDALNAAYSTWRAAYELALVPHLPGVTEAKNEARKAAEELARPFKRRYLDDPPVTDQQRVDMGFPPRRPPTPISPPSTAPELIPDTGTLRRISVSYRDEGSSHRGKPDNIVGIEVRWAFLDRPPVHLEEELVHSNFDTRSPLVLDFDEADRGKKIYMVGRWEIRREGAKGPFGAVVDVIVP